MRICVDPGHGGTDPGGASQGLAEKHLNLAISLLLMKELGEGDHIVTITRVVDEFVPLESRASFANLYNADCFLSIHCNASPNAGARGPWSIYAKGSTQGADLAEAIQRRLVSVAGGSDKAVYPDESPWVGGRRLAVLRRTRMPAVIIECGFMTNPQEIADLENLNHQRKLARAIAGGVRIWRP